MPEVRCRVPRRHPVLWVGWCPEGAEAWPEASINETSCADAVRRREARKGDDVCLLTEPETRLAALTIGGY